MALVNDTVRIQERLDDEVTASRERFAALLAIAPAGARDLLLPLIPNQLLVKEHHISCRLRMSASRSTSFELSVKPLNLGFATLYGTTAAEEASISVEVRSVSTPDTFTT